MSSLLSTCLQLSLISLHFVFCVCGNANLNRTGFSDFQQNKCGKPVSDSVRVRPCSLGRGFPAKTRLRIPLCFSGSLITLTAANCVSACPLSLSLGAGPESKTGTLNQKVDMQGEVGWCSRTRLFCLYLRQMARRS